MPRLRILCNSSWSSHSLRFTKQKKLNVLSTQTSTFHGQYARQTGTCEEGHGFSGLKWGAASLRGGCSRNDDSFVCGQPGSHGAVFGVFDGHGLNGGGHAAKLAAKQLHRLIFEHTSSTSPQKSSNLKGTALSPQHNGLQKAFVAFDRYLKILSNHHIKKKKKQELINRVLGVKGKSDFTISGTCAVVVMVGDEKITIANLGDSQAISKNGRLTKLHHCNNPEEAHRIYCNGGYILEDRLNGNLMPTRAFGDFYYKRTKSVHKNVLSCLPEITEVSRKECGDFLVLGSDGIFDVLPEASVMKICEDNAGQSEAQIAQIIVDKAIGLGSMDNVTCIVVRMAPVKSKHAENEPSQPAHKKNQKMPSVSSASPSSSTMSLQRALSASGNSGR